MAAHIELDVVINPGKDLVEKTGKHLYLKSKLDVTEYNEERGEVWFNYNGVNYKALVDSYAAFRDELLE